MLIYQSSGFKYDSYSYKCDRCGICTPDYKIIVNMTISKGRIFEWLKCPKCGFTGNLKLTK